MSFSAWTWVLGSRARLPSGLPSYSNCVCVLRVLGKWPAAPWRGAWQWWSGYLCLATWLRALWANTSFPAHPPGLFSALCADLAVRWDPGDTPVFSRGPCFPQASSLLSQEGSGQQRPCSRSVDGWVQRAVLPSQPPCPPGESLGPHTQPSLLQTRTAGSGLGAIADLVPEIEH